MERGNLIARDHFSVRAAISLILLISILALVTSRHFYLDALVSAFFSLTLATAAILYLRVCPYWPDVLATAGCTAFFYLLDFRILKFPPSIMAGFSFLGLASFLLLGLRAVWAPGLTRKSLAYAFCAGLLFAGSDYMASTMLDLTESVHPRTLDLFLYSFDCSMRVQFSFLAGQLFLKWHWLKVITILFYIALPIPIALVSAECLVRRKERFVPAVLAFLITGPLGIVFYNLFPAMGPVHLFGAGFPLHPPSFEQVKNLFLEPVAIHGPRNAIPSLHMAWVLLALWYSRGLSRLVKAVVWSFVAFTVLATLATGEHYFIDLVAAFPFALIVRGLCTIPLSWTSERRTVAILAGTVGTLVLLASLRFGLRMFWLSPILPWALVIIATVIPIYLTGRLESAERNPGVPQSKPVLDHVMVTAHSCPDKG